MKEELLAAELVGTSKRSAHCEEFHSSDCRVADEIPSRGIDQVFR